MKNKSPSLPVVAIVGRPNVGKSTLFNKIIGKRKAIVDNTVGLTRDRNYNITTFREKAFLLVDTGGFEPASEDSIVKQIKDQAYLAVDEANAVIFLCDGKEGVTGEDGDIYRYLRKTGKPLLVAVNKIDDPKHEERIFDFYQLGTESLFPVSAEHGTGIDDLLEKVFDHLPDIQGTEEKESSIKIAVVGRPNVGKSSLTNTILKEKRTLVDDSPGTTRDPVDTLFKRGDKEFLLIDTAGIRKKGKVTDVIEKFSVIMAIRSIERSDIALILIDAVEGITAQDSKIAGYAYEAGKGCIIVVNKWDMVKGSKTIESVSKEIRRNLKYLSFAPIVFVSAKTGEGINRLLSRTEMVFDEYQKKISTSKFNTFLKDIWERKHPSLYKGKVLKFFYSTQVKSAPPTFLVFVNYPLGIHFSYRRYMENRIREEFGFEGTPLRIVFKDRR